MGSPLVKVGVLSCKLCRKGLSRFVRLGAKGVLEGYLCVLNKFFRYGNVCTHLMCQYTCEVLLPLFLLLHPSLLSSSSFLFIMILRLPPHPPPAQLKGVSNPDSQPFTPIASSTTQLALGTFSHFPWRSLNSDL